MQLSVREADGRRHDVELSGEPGTTVASMLDALPGNRSGRPCYVGAAPLDPAATLANCPLVGGAMLAVGDDLLA